MDKAREIIANTATSLGRIGEPLAIRLIDRLTAAGYRIVGPGEVEFDGWKETAQDFQDAVDLNQWALGLIEPTPEKQKELLVSAAGRDFAQSWTLARMWARLRSLNEQPSTPAKSLQERET